MAALESREAVDELLQHMFAPGSSSALYFGLDVLAELVKVKKKEQKKNYFFPFSSVGLLASCPGHSRLDRNS